MRPSKRIPVRAYNTVAHWTGSAAPLQAAKLFRSAREITGESKLSDAPLVEPLERLCNAINEEARLSPFGTVVQTARLRELLVNRLRLDAIMRQYPEVLDTGTPDVILIAGLARTGTTLLHRLLAKDPNARFLPSWEAINPAPLPQASSAHTRKKWQAKRIRKAKRAAKVMRYLSPSYGAIHPIDAMAPEEDILLLDLTMMSQTAEAMCHVPSFSSWLETTDHRPAYAYLRDVLKVLNWRQAKPYWVLKTPNHAEHLDAIFDIFPRATVVQTHRDPVTSLASCCSLIAHTRYLSSDHVDLTVLGQHWLNKVQRMAIRSKEAREKQPSRIVVDLDYESLVMDPAKAVRKIYAARDEEASEEVLAAAAALCREPRDNKPKHKYQLSDFGLTESVVKRALSHRPR